MAVSARSQSERLHRRDQRGGGRGARIGFAPFWLVRALVDRGAVNLGHDPAPLKELLRSLQSTRFDPVLF
jgi:hypothetical protein